MSLPEKFQEYVNAFYEGDIQKGRDLLEEISRRKEDEKIYNTVVWNAQFYISKCPSELIRTLKPTFYQDKQVRKFAINPFIVQDKKTKQFIVGVRVLNYAGNDGMEPMVCQGKIVSQYEIYVFDPEMKSIQNSFPLTVKFFNGGKLVERDWPYATGTEDYRVIPTQDENTLLGSCTGIETHPQGPVRMCKFTLTIQREGENITGLVADNLIPLQGYEDDKQQKNWLFLHNPNLPSDINKTEEIVYSVTPLVLLEEKDGTCRKILEKENPFYKFRNGTPFIPFTFTKNQSQEGYLTLAHTSADHKHRVYYHRFFFFSLDFELLASSQLFYFEKAHTIEFASGMVFSPEMNCFYITLGFRDRFAHIHRLTLDNFYSMFPSEMNSN